MMAILYYISRCLKRRRLYISRKMLPSPAELMRLCVCVYITVVYITCRRKWITHGWEDAERESIESGQQQREREREKRVLYSCRSHSIYTVYISISSAWRESKKTHKSSSSLTSTVFFFFFLVCSFTISLFLYSLEFLSFSPATPNNLTGLHGSQRERRVLAYTL
jgi:hypothetical protein